MAYVGVIDSSGWQWPGYNTNTGNIDGPVTRPNFKKAIARGVVGVIHRAANGIRKDPAWDVCAAAALEDGLGLGAYQYIRPDRSAPDYQARFLLDVVGNKPSFLMADCENFPNQANWTRQQFADWLSVWINTLKNESDFPVIRYTGKWWWDVESTPQFGELDSILSRYPGGYTRVPPSDAWLWENWAFALGPSGPALPVGEDHWDGWQFSSVAKGSDFGFPADSADGDTVDVNIVTEEAWKRWTKRKPTILWDDMVPLAEHVRLIDTRNTGQRIAANSTLAIGVGDNQAVGIHVVAVGASGPGFLTIAGSAEAAKAAKTSAVNYVNNGAGAVSGTSYVEVATPQGAVYVFSSAATDVVIDVQALPPEPV